MGWGGGYRGAVGPVKGGKYRVHIPAGMTGMSAAGCPLLDLRPSPNLYVSCRCAPLPIGPGNNSSLPCVSPSPPFLLPLQSPRQVLYRFKQEGPSMLVHAICCLFVYSYAVYSLYLHYFGEGRRHQFTGTRHSPGDTYTHSAAMQHGWDRPNLAPWVTRLVVCLFAGGVCGCTACRHVSHPPPASSLVVSLPSPGCCSASRFPRRQTFPCSVTSAHLCPLPPPPPPSPTPRRCCLPVVGAVHAAGPPALGAVPGGGRVHPAVPGQWPGHGGGVLCLPPSLGHLHVLQGEGCRGCGGLGRGGEEGKRGRGSGQVD
jgi:hypothetical protein